MKTENCKDCLERRQLELTQRIGRVGYWEYDPALKSMFQPQPSLDLLAAISGTAREACQSLADVLPKIERKRFQAALKQAVARQLALRIELRLAGDNEHSHIVVRGAPVEDDGPPRFAGTFHDISHEKRIEAEREKVITQLQVLLDALPQGVSVIDQELRLLLWNRRFHEILDFPQGMVYRYARFEDFIRHNALRGEYGPGDPEEQVRAIVARAREFKPHRFERSQTGGRTILVEGYPFSFGGEISGFVTTYTDITERKLTEEQLTRQRDVMKTIIDNFPGAISLFDADLRMAACNEQLKQLLDFPDSLFERNDTRFEDLVRFNVYRGEYGPGDPEQQIAAIIARARNFQAHRIERTRPNGQWLEIRGSAIPSGGFVTSYIDITERKKAEERIRNLALHDPLTGLPNRLNLNDQIEQAVERAAAKGQRFALLFLDLDGFKKINDSYGHDVGDELLVHVARELRETVRETDVAARLAGDEFVVLLLDIDSEAMVGAIAGKIVSRLGQPRTLKGAGMAEIRIGTSIGIALYPGHGASREELLKAADHAMYVAKSGGKGGYRFSGAG
ncbi:MAG: PAS-domain containing protein [Rhodocyclales bacterium]|nr:PAS-domain containing protein [Rhodocyclales bacterium]